MCNVARVGRPCFWSPGGEALFRERLIIAIASVKDKIEVSLLQMFLNPKKHAVGELHLPGSQTNIYKHESSK